MKPAALAESTPSGQKTETPSKQETPPPVQEAKLKLNSEPSEAEVYISGTFVGNTPYEMDKPAEGKTVELSIRKAGYQDKTVGVSSLSSGSMQVTLEKKRQQELQPTKRASTRTSKATKPKATTSTKPAAKEPKRMGPTNEVLDPWN
jgi:hypothetical protein